jgi:hypothetical protein
MNWEKVGALGYCCNRSVDIDVLRELPAHLREGKGKVSVGLRQQKIIALSTSSWRPFPDFRPCLPKPCIWGRRLSRLFLTA